MTPILGLGAGGHGRVVIELVRAIGGWEIVGLLDPRRELWGTDVLGAPVLGSDAEMAAQYDAGVGCAFVGLGSTGDASRRVALFASAREHGFDFPALVHPRATVSPSATIGDGVTVMAGAVVNAGARVLEGAIVNTGAIVEHDCVVGPCAHVGPGARLASGVTVGREAHVGLGASVNQLLSIGPRAVVGSGAVVVRDVHEDTVVVGVPAATLHDRRA